MAETKTSKIQKIDLFLIISGLGILTFLILMVLTHGKVARWTVMEHNFDWQFSDFYRHVLYATDLKTIYTNEDAPFPPLSYCFFHLLRAINPGKEPNWSETEWREIQASAYNPLIFLVWNILIFSLLLLAIIQISKHPLFKNYLFFLALIFSVPFLSGAIERGSTVSVVLVLLLFSLYFSFSENKILREISLILIAVAAGWKIYPAIFGVLYLRERRYKEALRLVLYGVLIFFVPFIFTGGANGIKDYIAVITRFQRYSNPRWTDIKNFYYAVTYSLGGQPSYTVGTILEIIFFLMLSAGIFMTDDWWHAVLFTTGIITVCVSNSYRYTSIYMAVPLIFLIADQIKQGKLDYLNTILFALTFTMPVAGYFLNIGECDQFIFIPIYLILIINLVSVYRKKLLSK